MCNNPRSLRSIAWATSLFLAAACDRTPPPAGGPTIRDSSGVTIIENAALAPDSTSWWIDTLPAAVIGDDSRGAAHAFTWITDVELMSDGRIVVSDGRLNVVRMFDSTGAFLRTVGRRGQGPGEYTSAYRLSLMNGDTLIIRSVYDGAAAVVFGPTGEYVRTVSAPDFRSTDALRRSYSAPNFDGFFADGTALAQSRVRIDAPPGSSPPGKPELYESTSRLLRGMPSGSVVADYGDHVTARYFRYHNPDPRGYGAIYDNPAIVPRPRLTTFGTNLYIADGGTAEVRVFAADGALSRIVRRNAPAAPVQHAWADSIWNSFVQIISASPGANWLVNVEPPPFPDAPPAIDGLIVDTNGNIWVRSSPVGDAGGPVWHFFDPAGVLRYSLRWTGDVKRIGGGKVVSVTTDSAGVPRVLVHRLLKRD